MNFLTSRIRFFLLFLVVIGGLNPRLKAQTVHSCTVIPTDPPVVTRAPLNIPEGARAAVAYRPTTTYDTKWANGSTVTVRFLGGSPALRARVLDFAREWTQYANVNLHEVPSGQADIRVGFEQNGASWSMLGNASARAAQDKPSMNFGWLTDNTPDYEVKRTVLHEFGHALGLLHEHQNPTGGIPWDEAAVYDHYWRTQGWDQQMTYTNVMATADRDKTQFSAYDRASIMHYPIDARLTNGRYSVGMNNELSTTDRNYIAQLYPGRQVVTTTPSTTPTSPGTTTPGVTTPTPTPQRPTRPRPTPESDERTKPAGRSSYTVSITNEIGRDVKAETVKLYVGNRQYVIRLNREGRQQQRISLDLKPGQYRYRVESVSTYFGYRNIRLGRKLVKRYVERDVAGRGQGTLAITGDKDLTLYGSYDRSRGQMRVYLGERGK